MTRENKYIDKYLDGLMSEEESSAFETRCLEDQEFFLKLKAREQLRHSIIKSVEESGKTIFTEFEQRSPVTVGRIPSFFSWILAKPVRKFASAALVALSVFIIIGTLSSDKRFHTNTSLEHELGSKTLRGTAVTVLSPQLGGSYDDSITFSWEGDFDSRFEIIILNNKAEELEIIQTKEHKYQLDIKLQPGIYYWKLLQNGDWIYTGTFKISRTERQAAAIGR